MKYRLVFLFAFTLTYLALVHGCQSSRTSSSTFVPSGFVIPNAYTTHAFTLEKLTRAHAEQDYEAVMESKEELRAQFGGEWPQDDFTLEQNIKDIEEHERLFNERISFTYSVLSPDKKRLIGCIYINPVDGENADAQVHAWIRTTENAEGLEEKLKDGVVHWLTTDWPFDHIVFH